MSGRSSKKERKLLPLGTCPWRIQSGDKSDDYRLDNLTDINAIETWKITFPQAPSPTMTNFLRISDIMRDGTD
jgi:hypothetical protein